MKNKKLYIVFCILIVVFSASLAQKTLQNDTFALIALGRDEIVNGVNGYDHLTFHEDLKSAHSSMIFEISLYKVYDTWGFAGIYGLVMIMSAIDGLILFYFLLKKNKSKIISFAITIFSIYYMQFIFCARPTIMAMPLFLCIAICIEKILETNKNRYAIVLLIFSVILANVHDVMWIVHFIFYLPFLAEHILAICKADKLIKKKIIIQKYKNIKKLVIVILLDLLCGFITPFPGGTYLLIKEVIVTVTGKLKISELGTVNILYSIPLIIIIFFGMIQFVSKHKIRIADIFMLLGLIFMAIIGIRYGVFLYYIGILYINKIIDLMIKEYHREEIIQKLDDYFYNNFNLLIMFLIVLIISIKNFSNRITNEYVPELNFPVDISNYLIENFDPKNMRVYNDFNYGAYLEFRNIPNFIDGRSGIYYQKYGETSIVDDYLTIKENGEYESVFEKYKITHVILYNEEEANKKIYTDENYELLYQTDIFSLYLRK